MYNKKLIKEMLDQSQNKDFLSSVPMPGLFGLQDDIQFIQFQINHALESKLKPHIPDLDLNNDIQFIQFQINNALETKLKPHIPDLNLNNDFIEFGYYGLVWRKHNENMVHVIVESCSPRTKCDYDHWTNKVIAEYQINEDIIIFKHEPDLGEEYKSFLILNPKLQNQNFTFVTKDDIPPGTTRISGMKYGM